MIELKSSQPRGFVWLVGAGPGAIDLITVRGLRILQNAEVVVHDELVNRDLLQHCPAGCELHAVGKRCGRQSAAQEDIIELLLAQARAGRRVVRLKGGDPFVFGRGGEELSALLYAGIPCEIVPGVTAAAAAGAAAGIPLTHRELSSAVVFLTGHENPAKPESAIDWAAYAQLRATLCLYMGTRRLAGIAEQLIGGGMAIDTPVAVVSRASWPDERVEFLTLNEILGNPNAEIPAPAMVIIGEVARIPEQTRELIAMTAGI